MLGKCVLLCGQPNFFLIEHVPAGRMRPFFVSLEAYACFGCRLCHPGSGVAFLPQISTPIGLLLGSDQKACMCITGHTFHGLSTKGIRGIINKYDVMLSQEFKQVLVCKNSSTLLPCVSFAIAKVHVML